MTNIRDILDGTSVPYSEQMCIKEELSEYIRKMIFEKKIFKGTRWRIEGNSIAYTTFKIFGDYDISLGVVDVLRKFNDIDIYTHEPWKSGHSKITTLSIASYMDGDAYPVINFPSFAKNKEIKEIIDATGIILIKDSLESKINKAKEAYDRAVKEEEKWRV